MRRFAVAIRESVKAGHVLDRSARAVEHGHHHRLAVGDLFTTA
jgi:hypothetical protein